MSLDRRQLSTPITPLSLPATGDRSYTGNQPPEPAISGAIDQSTSHGRHQHPDPGSLERHLEPALALRPDHRQHSIPIGHDPRSAASFNQASVQSRSSCSCSIHRAHDAGSRRTLNHSGDCDRPFQPKVITDSGDRDHVLTRPTEVGVRVTAICAVDTNTGFIRRVVPVKAAEDRPRSPRRGPARRACPHERRSGARNA